MLNHWVREYFKAGDVIFQEGEIGEDAYLVEHGKVSILGQRGDELRVLSTINAGEMFGEIALIDRMTRSASAIAAEDASLIRISRSLVVAKLKDADPLLSHIVQLVVGRYRQSLGAPGRTSDVPQDDGLQTLSEYAVDQLKIAQNLSDAIQNDEFEVHYQPVVHLNDGHLGGFEALIRWNQPGAGLIPPVRFIGVAEDTGLIVPIGRWVLRTALAALAEFQAAMARAHPSHEPLFMSINVSARQLAEFGEIDVLADLVRASGINPNRIKLEVTESTLIKQPETAVLALRQLKALGLQLAIDDFGTGYSSLSYLSMFPLDTLKIDQSFVGTLLENEGSLRITRAIAGLARDLGMNCIAEGIEEAAHGALLRDLGCELGQGYHYSKPLDYLRVMDYIEARGCG
jgi:diguanylate cyclase